MCIISPQQREMISTLQGIKTVVTVNNLELVKRYAAEAQGFNEVWLNYQDDQPPLRAKHPGDPPAPLPPRLAPQVPFPPPLSRGFIDLVPKKKNYSKKNVFANMYFQQQA